MLGSVPKELEGVASGANAAFRELGGVFGIALLGAVFSSHGGYLSAQDYVNGLRPAIYERIRRLPLFDADAPRAIARD